MGGLEAGVGVWIAVFQESTIRVIQALHALVLAHLAQAELAGTVSVVIAFTRPDTADEIHLAVIRRTIRIHQAALPVGSEGNTDIVVLTDLGTGAGVCNALWRPFEVAP